MDIALRRLAIVASLLTSAVCSGSNTSPTPPPLTGSVTDLTGDTVIFPVLRDGVLMTPVVPIPPDLVAATIDVTGGNLTATIACAGNVLAHRHLCVPDARRGRECGHRQPVARR
jgi:hypothetical protein